jgi:hypothetical protein
MKLSKIIESIFDKANLAESMIGIQTKANFKPLQLKGALERAGVKGYQMNRLSVTLTALKFDKKYFNTAKKIIADLGLKVMMAKESRLAEGIPFPQDTPNEFAYLDFKKWAYKYRGQYKKDIKAAGSNTAKIFKTATKWWTEWDKRKDKQYSNIKDSQKFGRALIVMMWKDNLIFDKNSNRISKLQEAKLARGLKPLLQVGAKITKKVGEDALMKLSDKFDRIDDEYAGDIASHLDMAIELMQDGYPGDATKMLKQFNKKCKDVLKGKTVKSVFAEGKLNERSGLVAKTKAGSFTVHIVKNMKKLFLRIEKGGNTKTAILDKAWTDNQAEDVIEDIDEKGIALLWRQLKNVDHPKYNSMDKSGKITVKKLGLSQQSLGRESVNEAKFSNFKQYILKLAKEMGDRDLERDAKNSSKLKKMFDRDLDYKKFKDNEVTKYDGKKLHNMIKYDRRFKESIDEAKMTKKHANIAIKLLKPFKSVENVKPHGEFLLVAYTNYKDRAKIIKQLEKVYKYSSDGRMTNAPRVIGIAGYNWISFVSRNNNETFNAASVGKAPKIPWKDDQGLGDA